MTACVGVGARMRGKRCGLGLGYGVGVMGWVLGWSEGEGQELWLQFVLELGLGARVMGFSQRCSKE